MTRKKDKKLNSLKHGAFSRELMLPGERIADYEELLQAHYDEWVPEGVTELCLVDELTALRWKKRRMAQYDQILLRQRNAQVRQNNEVYRHRRNLRHWGAEFSEAANAEEADKILAQLSPSYKKIVEDGVPRENCADPTLWHQEVGKFLSNLKSEDPVEGPNLFAKIVNPDLIEMEISRSDRLDEAIDRKIKRLMQVKTAKQVFPSMRKNARPEPKLINALAAADDEPPVISENKPKLAEVEVSLKSDQEMSAIATKNNTLIEGTLIDEGATASASPVVEKEHPGPVRAKVEFFAKPTATTVEELNAFSAFCGRVTDSVNSNTSRNPASLPPPA
jgi:hypothetical protein